VLDLESPSSMQSFSCLWLRWLSISFVKRFRCPRGPLLL
jgi:hypothetical protein